MNRSSHLVICFFLCEGMWPTFIDAKRGYSLVLLSVWGYPQLNYQIVNPILRRVTCLQHVVAICSISLFGLLPTAYHYVCEAFFDHISELLAHDSTWRWLIFIRIFLNFKIDLKTAIEQRKLHSATVYSVIQIFNKSLFSTSESVFNNFEVRTCVLFRTKRICK